jgi:hypothetical protein
MNIAMEQTEVRGGGEGACLRKSAKAGGRGGCAVLLPVRCSLVASIRLRAISPHLCADRSTSTGS